MVVIFCPASGQPESEQERIGAAAHMHGAGAALRHAAAELGAAELQLITQHPQQRLIIPYVDCMIGAVNVQFHFGQALLPTSFRINVVRF